MECLAHAVLEAPRPLELAAEHGEPAEHQQQPWPGHEGQGEHDADQDEGNADGDAAGAESVLDHGEGIVSVVSKEGQRRGDPGALSCLVAACM